MSLPLPPPAGHARRLRWLLTLPKLGIILLLAALLSLLWLLHRNEAEEERHALIKDVLWLEQNLRFHLNSNEEQLQQLALEMSHLPAGKKTFHMRAEHMLKNSPDIAQILWLDNNRNVIDALPDQSLPDKEIESFGPSATSEAFATASRLGKQHYSQPFFLEGNRAFVELLAPTFSDRRLTGMLVVIYRSEEHTSELQSQR